MPRRGLSASKRKSRRGHFAMVEPLEERRLLTTWVGGGVTTDAQGNIVPVFKSYYYIQPSDLTQATGLTVEVNIGGDTTVEAIFYGATGNATEPIGIETDPNADVGYLFQMYVARSDIHSVVTITPLDTSGLVPFSSGAASLAIRPDTPLPDENPPTGTGPGNGGAVILGGLLGTSPGLPVVKQNIDGQAIGVRPANLDDLPDDPANDLSAGLVVGPGLSLGKFMVGGDIFGKVYVPGNMNLFYAGWILTGDARGASEGSGFINTGTTTVPVGTPGADGGPISLADGLEIPRGNFYVGGDLQNLATVGPIGWDGIFGTPAGNEEGPHFLSGVDIEIGGKLGAINALDGDASSVHVLNNSQYPEPVENQEEVEGLNATYPDFINGTVVDVPADFTTGALIQYIPGGNINPFVNNTFDNAQYLGSFNSPMGPNTITLNGNYDSGTDPDRDPNDYYGVGLMAGQTITVQVNSLIQGQLVLPATEFTYVGIFDPNGRLIATDYNNDTTNDLGLPFQFTANTPGVYRIAIGSAGDVEFNDFATSGVTHLLTATDYQVRVSNVGDLAVGGVQTRGMSLETNAGWEKLKVDTGDVGGIYAATNFHVTQRAEVLLNPNAANPRLPAPQNIGTAGIYIVNGDLRSFVAGAIGLGRDSTPFTVDLSSAPDLNVPNGSVGLIQALTGIIELNPNNMGTAPAIAIGGSYQVIQGSPSVTENMILGLVANGGIGIIDGPNMEESPSVITADADSKGNDGTIDLIDIAGNLEQARIWHGPGGDVRFMRVGGQILSDPSFNNGQGNRLVYNYNQSVTVTDDSGSTILLTPLGQEIPNPLFDASVTDLTNIASVQSFGPRLTMRTYPIASGGVCIVDVASTGGLQVTANANGVDGRAEISRIEVHGDALAPVETTDRRTGITTVAMAPQYTTGTTTDAAGNVISGSQQAVTNVIINGSAITDVANIVVMAADPQGPADFPPLPVSAVTALGNATQISNNTGGDIIGVAALSIGQLYSKGEIGLGQTSIRGLALRFNSVFTVGTAIPGPRAETVGDAPDGSTANEMPVNPVSVPPGPLSLPAGDSYPFHGQSYGIAVGGDVVSIIAAQGVGNIVVDGIVGQITANSDHSNVPGLYEGINGPIWAFGGTGSLLSVNIGEGILPSGSGSFSYAGLYADHLIGTVNNQGVGSDIRGDIVSGGRILNVNLNGGAIINGEVLVLSTGTVTVGGVTYAAWEAARQNRPIAYVIPHSFTVTTHPLNDIQNINISGQGGIIGSFIQSYGIGSVTVGGFGIIDTQILSPFDGKIGVITAGGYGVRQDTIGQGAIVAGINANGNGSNLSTADVTASVRQSESQPIDPIFQAAFDPFSGRSLSIENDLHADLGTSAATPVIPGVTDTGVVEDSAISGETSLGFIDASQIRATSIGDVNNPNDPDNPANVAFPMQLQFGNNIGTIKTSGLISGLRVVTGTIKKFQPGSDVLALNLTTSGKIRKLQINGSLAGNSVINAVGRNGGISQVKIHGNLVGTLHVANNVRYIAVDGNISGNLQIDGLSKGLALGKLYIGQALINGSLNVTGNVGTIQTGLGLGAAGDNLTLTGSLRRLKVGNGVLAANLNVGGKLGTVQVNGWIDGDITAGVINSVFSKLIVNAPAGAPGAINGNILVNGTLKNARISGANVAANINAVDGIGNFQIRDGSLSPNVTLQSSTGSIKQLKIVDGNLFGSVLAQQGSIRQINVSNNIGDGIDPLTIATTALNTLKAGGSILSGVTIDVTGPMGVLQVGGSINGGSTITAASLKRVKVAGTIAPGVMHIG